MIPGTIPVEFEFHSKFRQNHLINLKGPSAKFDSSGILGIARILPDSSRNQWRTVKTSVCGSTLPSSMASGRLQWTPTRMLEFHSNRFQVHSARFQGHSNTFRGSFQHILIPTHSKGHSNTLQGPFQHIPSSFHQIPMNSKCHPDVM